MYMYVHTHYTQLSGLTTVIDYDSFLVHLATLRGVMKRRANTHPWINTHQYLSFPEAEDLRLLRRRSSGDVCRR